MNRRNTKGQVTIFMLVGVGILIVALVLFFTTQSGKERESGTNALESQEAALKVQGIKNYVTACLSKTTRDAVDLLGQQGGIIYEDQGGIPLSQDPTLVGVSFVGLSDTAEFSRFPNVSVYYGVKRLTSNYPCETISCIPEADGMQSDVNNYPWEGYSRDNPFPNARGCVDLRCFGKNRLLSQGLGQMYRQIEVYIENKLPSCLDYSQFKEFTITPPESLDATVTTTDDSVVATIEYPLKITDIESKQQITLKEFFTDTGVRLQWLFNMANILVNKDVDDEDFDITTEPLEGVTIEVIRNGVDGFYINPPADNVVRLTDEKLDEPYVFQFARQNRAPVLENIESPVSITDPTVTTLTPAVLAPYITAYDPDEDPIIIQYYNKAGVTFDVFDDFEETCSTSYTVGVCVSDNKFTTTCNAIDHSRDYQEITITC